jgi:hypothetical protein
VWLLQNNPLYEEVEVDEEFLSEIEQNEEMQETSNVIDFDMGQMRATTTIHEVPTQELDDSDDDLEQQFLHVSEQKDVHLFSTNCNLEIQHDTKSNDTTSCL